MEVRHEMLIPTIRLETDSDHQLIRDITVAAFEKMPFAAGDEHELVDALRAAGALHFSLIAELDGQVVGQAAFSQATASDGTGRWFALGPISVVPDYQKKGIGTSLIRTGLDLLAREGAAGCILTGDPRYYERFGFNLTPAVAPEGEPVEYYQLKVIRGPYPTGKVHFHPAFGSGAEHAAAPDCLSRHTFCCRKSCAKPAR